MVTQLAVKTDNAGKSAQGYCTPKEDKQPQKMSVPPRRVIPIVFLPGIMGSNLRMSAARQAALKKSNNIAWRPDRNAEALSFMNADATRRQLTLDPSATEVDTFDDGTAPTGDVAETAKERHSNGKLKVSLSQNADSTLLIDDPVTVSPRKSREDKAKDRGWSEVYFSSYRDILEQCEQYLNRPFDFGYWGKIVGEDPSRWGATPNPCAGVLTEAEFKRATKECIFPVHAMGYNWLQSNVQSAQATSNRIRKLIQRYQQLGYECAKVIVVTHSMGGLVGRALVHPSMGNARDEILGIVHGVQPALGAPAAYKRMRCGFEEGFFGLDPTPKVLGNHGSEVTAVLGNAPGGLQLLPSCEYGNGWLEIRHRGNVIDQLPKNGDPYGEIYSLQQKWFGLLREEWLNPADQRSSGIGITHRRLQEAKRFHQEIASTYHEQTYAHYGADTNRPSWESVSWDIKSKHLDPGWREYVITRDNQKGKLRLSPQTSAYRAEDIDVVLGESIGAGDQTVPIRSSDQQLLSGHCRAVFRQVGYEHQASYSNSQAIASTMYSIIKIAALMRWSCDA